ALDEEVAAKLQKNNPEAFKNVVRRLLEASGRGMWETDDETIEKLKSLYADADDLVEQRRAPDDSAAARAYTFPNLDTTPAS
ncbi:hypothetical protein THAOC_26477, partial [Thalassiosira oceanica]